MLQIVCYYGAENLSQNRVGTLRSDRGGEYMSSEFNVYLAKRGGIKHQHTSLYTPQQKGVAQRKNRSLMEMARCMVKSQHQAYHMVFGLRLLSVPLMYLTGVLPKRCTLSFHMRHGEWPQAIHCSFTCFWLLGICISACAKTQKIG